MFSRVERLAARAASGLKGRSFDENWQRGVLVTRKLVASEFYREHVGACLILCDFLSTPRNIDNARRCCFTSRFSIPLHVGRGMVYIKL